MYLSNYVILFLIEPFFGCVDWYLDSDIVCASFELINASSCVRIYLF